MVVQNCHKEPRKFCLKHFYAVMKYQIRIIFIFRIADILTKITFPAFFLCSQFFSFFFNTRNKKCYL